VSRPVDNGRCNGTTRRGTRCPNPAESVSGLCVLHDPAREADKREHMAALGRSSQAKRRARAEREAEDEPDPVPLQSTRQMRQALERAAALVLAGGDAPSVKANALARIVAVAGDVRRAMTDEEIDELRALLRAHRKGGAHAPAE
jgi:hypothetical protein